MIFPNPHDRKTVAARTVLGDDWILASALRSRNQALGRLLRHQHDYGVALLGKHLLLVETVGTQQDMGLPAWLPSSRNVSLEDVASFVSDFFSQRPS